MNHKCGLYKDTDLVVSFDDLIKSNEIIVDSDIIREVEPTLDGELIVPEQYKIISANAFRNCELSKIVFLGKVESVQSFAFYGCSNLFQIVGIENAKCIGAQAFAKTPIESICLNPTTICNEPFYKCLNLKHIVIKNNNFNKNADGNFVPFCLISKKNLPSFEEIIIGDKRFTNDIEVNKMLLGENYNCEQLKLDEMLNIYSLKEINVFNKRIEQQTER